MKRFMLVLACVLVLVFSMTACDHDVDNGQNITMDSPTDGHVETISTEGDVDVTEEVPTELEVTEPVVEETDAPIPAFEYKMAKLYEEAGDGYTELWFVVECLHHDFGFTQGGEFVIMNDTTSEDITELSWVSDSNYDMVVYTGNICVTDHMASRDGLKYGHTDDDRRQYVVMIRSSNAIAFDDFVITANLYYNGGSGVDSLETVVLEFNTDMAGITTYQKYVHGTTLFELDGKYYIAPDDAGIGSGDNHARGISVDFTCINGTVYDLLDSLTGKISFVYGRAAERNEAMGYIGDESWLASVETPDGAKPWLYVYDGRGSDPMMFGYQSANGDEIPNEDAVKDLSRSILPVYTFEDGRIMTFFFE